LWFFRVPAGNIIEFIAKHSDLMISPLALGYLLVPNWTQWPPEEQNKFYQALSMALCGGDRKSIISALNGVGRFVPQGATVGITFAGYIRALMTNHMDDQLRQTVRHAQIYAHFPFWATKKVVGLSASMAVQGIELLMHTTGAIYLHFLLDTATLIRMEKDIQQALAILVESPGRINEDTTRSDAQMAAAVRTPSSVLNATMDAAFAAMPAGHAPHPALLQAVTALTPDRPPIWSHPGFIDQVKRYALHQLRSNTEWITRSLIPASGALPNAQFRAVHQSMIHGLTEQVNNSMWIGNVHACLLGHGPSGHSTWLNGHASIPSR